MRDRERERSCSQSDERTFDSDSVLCRPVLSVEPDTVGRVTSGAKVTVGLEWVIGSGIASVRSMQVSSDYHELYIPHSTNSRTAVEYLGSRCFWGERRRTSAHGHEKL